MMEEQSIGRMVKKCSCLAVFAFATLIRCSWTAELPLIHSLTVDGATGTIRIKCIARGHPPPRLSWQINGTNVEMLGDRYEIKYYNRTQLVIENSEDKDSGLYRCSATNSLGTIFAEKYIRIKGVGKFLNGYDKYSEPIVRNVTIGKPYELTCPPHTVKYGQQYKWVQSPMFIWQTGVPVKRAFMLKSGSLMFSSIRMTDVHRINNGGGISCVLVVDVANLVPSVHVKLRSVGEVYTSSARPEILAFMSPVTTAVEGDVLLQLECGAIGKPHPTFFWYKDDKPIYMHRMKRSILGDNYIFKADGMLLIIQTVKKESAGRYRCAASNGDGNDSKEGLLVVNSRVKWVKSKRPPTRFVKLWGKSVKFEFVADGKPKPTYEWFHNSSRITSSTLRTINGGSLEIPVSDFSDGGLYLCLAKNYINTIVSAVYVEIKAFPPTFLQTWEKVYYFLEGYENQLRCNVNGGPTPTITWSHNGVALKLHRASLKFEKSAKTDNGTYQCVAENTEGMVEMITELIVFAETVITQAPAHVSFAPGQQVNLFCNARYDVTLPVKYEWLKDDKMLSYTDRINLRKRVLGSTKNVLTIDDLQFRDAGMYSCRVHTSYNGTFRSQDEKSGSITVVGPPLKPHNLNIEGDCTLDDEITLTWEAPTGYIGPITEYKVEYASVDDIHKWYKYETSQPIKKTTVNLEVSKLPPSTGLLFHVRGVAKKGSSEIYGKTCDTTNFGCITPAGAPIVSPADLRAALDDDRNINVTWKVFDKISQPEPGFKVIVRYRTEPNGTFTNATLLGSDNSYVIPVDNEDEGSVYDVYVNGVNKKGDGPAAYLKVEHPGSNEITTKVRNVDVVEVTANSVTLSWDEIGLATGYIVYFSKEDRRRRREVSNEFKIFPRGSGGKIDNLESNGKYRITVAAMNLNGKGPLSDPIMAFTKRDVPGIPLNVDFKTYGNVIFLSWSPPHKADEYLSQYVISWYESGDREKRQYMNISVANQQAFINDDLDSMTYYTVELAAKNDIGVGKAWVLEGIVVNEPDLPGKPAPPLLARFNESTINATFRLPSLYYGGMPDKFKVFYVIKGEDDNETKHVLGYYPRQSWVILPSLNLTTYRIWSVAINSLGAGEYSDLLEMPLDLLTTLKPTPYNDSIPIVIVKGKATSEDGRFYMETWFIVLLALIILIIIIALILCALVHKNGGRYPVGKKEKKLGGWDNQLIKDYSDNPMEKMGNGVPYKNLKDPFYRPPRNSIAKDPSIDEDTDSLDYYGEDNTFNEDGSFIGEYAADKRTINGETFL